MTFITVVFFNYILLKITKGNKNTTEITSFKGSNRLNSNNVKKNVI